MSYDVLLSLRAADRGGGRREAILEELRPDCGRPIFLFVHGFNVNRRRALAQWAALAGYLGAKSQVQRGPFLWPSDLYRSRSLSRVTYPMIVPLARQCGRKLGDYLRRRPNQRCVLIGHSLGALVVLEAAYRFRSATILDGLGLAGAAVGVADLADSGPFDIPLAEREGVGYSPRDPVLQRVFGIGSRLTTPFISHGEAVGLHGAPHDRPWTHRQDFEIDHHDHWREAAVGRFTAAILGDLATRSPREAPPPPQRHIRQRTRD
ncbi:alpha/beta hydrolase [Nocardia pseudobrasiliensis]|uniref:Alpha/beta hydrolase family protein DUF900 n=1 Tax=Nocardia pseudobrasiliensis TaxID=45979 RepID=A0A370I2F9_9NOCA|nr:alpha/beta hydrolase [Nocardia pseudobrasiliensis]RDI63474.1 alpha/beta hydrolase family protein DUF900 [Nocardia pseudobrasiliensis]